ncbi:MAG: hypothetical protein ACP5OX_01470 [Minisyncoccia bacterium]
MIIKRILGNNENNILRFFTDRIHCLVSLNAENDFLKSYENAGIKVNEIVNEIVILDVSLKRARNIRIWFLRGSNNQAPLILTDTHFLLTTKKAIIGIRGIDYIPLGIYFNDQNGEGIWGAGAIRKEKATDIDNLRNLLSIFQFIYGKGEMKILIGPTHLDVKPILEIIKEIGQELNLEVYCCDLNDLLNDLLKTEFKTIFYFKGGERWGGY